MTETEAILKIASELGGICFLLALINAALWFILFFKKCRTDDIKDAIKELTSIIKSRR